MHHNVDARNCSPKSRTPRILRDLQGSWRDIHQESELKVEKELFPESYSLKSGGYRRFDDAKLAVCIFGCGSR